VDFAEIQLHDWLTNPDQAVRLLDRHARLVRYATSDHDNGTDYQQLASFIDDYGSHLVNPSFQGFSSRPTRYVAQGSLLRYSRAIIKGGLSHDEAWLEATQHLFEVRPRKSVLLMTGG
jgi:hypothetical protein